MKPSRKTLAVAAVLTVLGATALAWWKSRAAAEEPAYITETVTRGAVAAAVTATGTVNPVKTVQVGTYTSGPIQAIYADFNAKVSKGQIVAKIDPRPFEVKVAAADASVANARARADKSRADLVHKKLMLERNAELVERELVARNDYDTAKSQYDQARAQLALDEASVKQALTELEAARINLAYTDITSPVDGVVVSRNVDVGQTVAASFQTPTLFLIAQDLTKMQVNANVSESDIGAVAAGQPASFRVDAYPQKEFRGTVAQVRNSPTNVQNVITYDVVVTVENPDLELRPGMTATVSIVTAERADTLRVPLPALRFRPERAEGAGVPTPRAAADGEGDRKRGRSPAVWVLRPGERLERVRVATDVQDDRYAAVASGDLREGDVVVLGYRTPATTASAEKPPPFVRGGGGRRFR